MRAVSCGRVEAHRVLGGDEVEPPLRLSLQRERRRQLRVGRARSSWPPTTASSMSISAAAEPSQQLVRALLDRVDARLISVSA